MIKLAAAVDLFLHFHPPPVSVKANNEQFHALMIIDVCAAGSYRIAGRWRIYAMRFWYVEACASVAQSTRYSHELYLRSYVNFRIIYVFRLPIVEISVNVE